MASENQDAVVLRQMSPGLSAAFLCRFVSRVQQKFCRAPCTATQESWGNARKAMLSARASRTRLGDNAEMPPESLEDLNRLRDSLMMKDAVSNEKVSSMKEDKATLKIYHQRCAHKGKGTLGMGN